MSTATSRVLRITTHPIARSIAHCVVMCAFHTAARDPRIRRAAQTSATDQGPNSWLFRPYPTIEQSPLRPSAN